MSGSSRRRTCISQSVADLLAAGTVGLDMASEPTRRRQRKAIDDDTAAIVIFAAIAIAVVVALAIAMP